MSITRGKLIIAGVVIAGGLMLTAPVAGILALSTLQSSSCVPSVPSSAGLQTFEQYQRQFDESTQQEQRRYAELIVQIGQERKLSSRTIEVAVATAIQESDLQNLPFGDRDSLGLFQQRPSAGWGTQQEILSPHYSINKFYDRVELIDNRDERPMIDVAMVVQIPDRDAYVSRWKWDDIARDVVAGRSGSTGVPPVVGCGTLSIDGWRAPLDTIQVTSSYGLRVHPVYGTVRRHYGVDFDGANGEPIYAIADGVVTTHQTNSPGYGQFVQITHSGGVVSGYAHMSAISSKAQQGATIKAGDLVGYVGSTGVSTGNHLHFEISVNGEYVDPIAFFENVIGLPIA